MTIIIFTQFGCSREHTVSKPVYEMSNIEIDQLLTATSQRRMMITDRITYYSEMFLGMPYNLTCTGDGPYALLESRPLVNFQETNCMVFCEHVLALAISDSWDNFFNNLQQIRYRDGIIGMRTRNHYTMADWLPENGWLLTDVTDSVGDRLTQSVTRTISHREFFKDKGITDLRYIKPERTITIQYVPKEHLKTVEARVQTGDILALIYAQKDIIFSAHMLMIAEKKNRLVVRESSSSKMTTFDSPYDEWAARIAAADRYLGVSFMRIRSDLNQAGRIIVPWEIDELKRKLQ